MAEDVLPLQGNPARVNYVHLPAHQASGNIKALSHVPLHYIPRDREDKHDDEKGHHCDSHSL